MMKPTPDRSIRVILSDLNASEENDVTFITAAVLNLYSEANRRIHGKVLFTGADVRNVLSICDTLLSPREPEPAIAPPQRGRELTAAESKSVM